MLHLEGKRVGITGASSMVGIATINELRARGAETVGFYHDNYNFTDPNQAHIAMKKEFFKLDYVVHCAGFNGNIKFNKEYPYDIFFRTTVMALNIYNSAIKNGIKHIVSPLSSCAYPDVDLLKEADFLAGAPNESVEAHGLSKRNILAMSRQVAKQHPDYRYVCCIFNTCYGPYDSYDENKTKVVGGMIKRFVEAKRDGLKEVVCWGTGKPRRELVFVDDAAKGLVDTLVYYDDPTLPLNVGAGTDTSIKELAEAVADVVGFDGKIEWDTTKPDGQYRKLLDNTRMKELLPAREFTSLKDGLTKTVEWYRSKYEQ